MGLQTPAVLRWTAHSRDMIWPHQWFYHHPEIWVSLWTWHVVHAVQNTECSPKEFHSLPKNPPQVMGNSHIQAKHREQFPCWWLVWFSVVYTKCASHYICPISIQTTFCLLCCVPVNFQVNQCAWRKPPFASLEYSCAQINKPELATY